MSLTYIANGWTTPQGEALLRGDHVALKKWLDDGGDPNKSFNGHCLLHMALYGGQDRRPDRSDMVRLLVSYGADMNVRRGEDGIMPIHLCSYPSEASLLLDLGADVDARTDDGRTPIFCFTFGGRLECARFIVRRGADVKLTADDDGWDAFDEAREEGIGHEHHQEHRHLDEEGVWHPHQPAAHEHVLPPTSTPNQRIEPFDDEHLGGTIVSRQTER